MSSSSTVTLRNREPISPSIRTDEDPRTSTSSITVSACFDSNIEAGENDPLSPVDVDRSCHNDPKTTYPHSVHYAASQNGPSETSPSTFKRSLGRRNATVIVCTNALSFAVLGFLCFLWTGYGPGTAGVDARETWRLIVVNGWIIQVVTIATTILRFAFSIQLPIVTSMVAALILERRHVPLSLSASLSTYRAVNGGLQSLFMLRKVRKVLKTPEMLLLGGLALTTTALQFSSTILLSDVQGRPVKSFTHSTQSMLAMLEYFDPSFFPNPMDLQWNTLGIYGETESNPYSVEPNITGVSTTGIRQHAMLPPRDNQKPLYNYEGPTHLLGSQVSCVPPVMELGVEVISWPTMTQGTKAYGIGNALINYNQTFERSGLQEPTSFRPGNISCPIGDVFAGHPGLSLCLVGSPIASQDWSGNPSPWGNDSQLILAFRNRANMTDSDSEQNDFPKLKALMPKDEWQIFEFYDSQIDVSICFLRWGVRLASAKISTKRRLDPFPLPLGNVSPELDKDFNTTAMRQVLGVQPDKSTSERGIMFAEEVEESEEDSTKDPTASLLTDSISSTLGADNPSPFKSIPLCALKPIYSAQPVSEGMRAIFCNIADHTDRSALLVHILVKIIAQITHDQLTPFFTGSAPAKAAEEVTRNRPTRFTGLIAVVLLVVASSACIMTIVRLYLRHCKYTKIDDFWYAISQAISEDTANILLRGNMSTDKELFENNQDADKWVRLERCSVSGRVELVKVDTGCDGYPLTDWSSTMVETG